MGRLREQPPSCGPSHPYQLQRTVPVPLTSSRGSEGQAGHRALCGERGAGPGAPLKLDGGAFPLNPCSSWTAGPCVHQRGTQRDSPLAGRGAWQGEKSQKREVEGSSEGCQVSRVRTLREGPSEASAWAQLHPLQVPLECEELELLRGFKFLPMPPGRRGREVISRPPVDRETLSDFQGS